MDKFIISNKEFHSRLLVGTGKYKNLDETLLSIQESGTNIITVAVRRLSVDCFENQKNFLKILNWNKYWILPNTAGSKTSDEAIRMAFLGKEIATQIGQFDNNFIKLEVIPDHKYLMPDPLGTLKAADFLIKKGFSVLPYINNDPILAHHLEEIGCSTIMPLGSSIGSNQGLKSLENLSIIIENAKIPIIIDAGIGQPSDATLAMELGADAILVNSCIAYSQRPEIMAKALKFAVLSGRLAYQVSKTNKKIKKSQTISSSPLKGLFF